MPPTVIGDGDVVMTMPPRPLHAPPDTPPDRDMQALCPYVPLISSNHVDRPNHPSFNDRYILGSQDASGPASTFFCQDLSPAFTMPSHVAQLGRSLPSLGNVVQERSFHHACGQDTHAPQPTSPAVPSVDIAPVETQLKVILASIHQVLSMRQQKCCCAHTSLS